MGRADEADLIDLGFNLSFRIFLLVGHHVVVCLLQILHRWRVHRLFLSRSDGLKNRFWEKRQDRKCYCCVVTQFVSTFLLVHKPQGLKYYQIAFHPPQFSG